MAWESFSKLKILIFDVCKGFLIRSNLKILDTKTLCTNHNCETPFCVVISRRNQQKIKTESAPRKSRDRTRVRVATWPRRGSARTGSAWANKTPRTITHLLVQSSVLSKTVLLRGGKLYASPMAFKQILGIVRNIWSNMQTHYVSNMYTEKKAWL